MSARGLRLPAAEELRALRHGPAAAQRRDWQCHHLLPRALARHRQISDWLADVGGIGPAFKERQANILWLPAREALAAATGMALHRGPHPAYNDLIAARLDRIRKLALAPSEAQARIARLQRVLAATLSGGAPATLKLNRHDPMRLFADYASLDAAIVALIADQPR